MPIAPKGPEDNNQKPLSRRPWIGTALIYIVVIGNCYIYDFLFSKTII